MIPAPGACRAGRPSLAEPVGHCGKTHYPSAPECEPVGSPTKPWIDCVTEQSSNDVSLDQLKTRGEAAAAKGIKALFAADPARFDRFSFRHDDLLLDVSKTALSAEDLDALHTYARTVGVLERRDAMYAGARINTTENRAVLHVALRARPEDGFAVEGQAVGAEVEGVLEAMARFAARIRDGSIRARRARRSPTSSISASAARTSAPSWPPSP